MVIDHQQLPDFLEALTIQTSPSPLTSNLPLPVSPSRSPERTSASQSVSKLRYDAYEPPQVVNRLRRPTSAQRSISSGSRSAAHSDHGSRDSRKLSFDSEGRPSLDELSRTITAGDLALATGDIELEMMARVSVVISAITRSIYIFAAETEQRTAKTAHRGCSTIKISEIEQMLTCHTS